MSKYSPDADVAFISALAELLNKNELTELSVKRDYGDDDSLEVRVVKQANIVTTQMAAPAPVAYAAAPAAAPSAAAAAAAAAPAVEDPAQHPGAVTSPMVGTVYMAAEPGASPFITIGATVTEGQTVLIIEAMKTMNHIPAPRAGTVKRIMVEDGTPVEFGAPLLIIGLIGMIFAIDRPQRRHRMQIDQQRRPPHLADAGKLVGKKAVVGAVDAGNACGQFAARQPPAPDLARARQTARHQPEPAARAAVAVRRGARGGGLRCQIVRPAALDHVPVDIVLGAVEIHQRARRVRHQQPRPRRLRNHPAEPVNQPVFQPQLRPFRITHPRHHSRRIGASRVWHCNQHRQAHLAGRGEGKGCPSFQPRHLPAADAQSIAPRDGIGIVLRASGQARHCAHLAAAFATRCQSLIVCQPGLTQPFFASSRERFLKSAVLYPWP